MSFWKDHFVLDRKADSQEADTLFVPVLWKQRRPAFGLYATAFGWGFLMTGLIAGGTLGAGMAWGDALKAIIIGNLILFAIAVLSGQPGYQTGAGNNPMYMFVYGKKGFGIAAVILMLAIIGWQIMITGMTSAVWLQTTSGTAYAILTFIIGIIYMMTTYKGIRGLELIAYVALGIMVVVGLYAVYYNINLAGGWEAFKLLSAKKAAESVAPVTMMAAINIIVGAWVGGSVLGSEFTRFCKTRGTSIIFMIIAVPAVQFGLNVLGVIGGVGSGTHDFTVYLGQLGFGVWLVSVIAMTFALWTSCNVNLYFPASMFSYLFNVPRKGGVLDTGTVSAILAATGLYTYFTGFLNLLGATLPALCGPVFADYFIINKGRWDIKLIHKMPAWNWATILGFVGGLTAKYIYLPSWCPEPIWAVVMGMVVTLVVHAIAQAAGHPQGYAAIKHLEQEPIMPMEDDSQYGDFEENFIYYDEEPVPVSASSNSSQD